MSNRKRLVVFADIFNIMKGLATNNKRVNFARLKTLLIGENPGYDEYSFIAYDVADTNKGNRGRFYAWLRANGWEVREDVDPKKARKNADVRMAFDLGRAYCNPEIAMIIILSSDGDFYEPGVYQREVGKKVRFIGGALSDMHSVLVDSGAGCIERDYPYLIEEKNRTRVNL